MFFFKSLKLQISNANTKQNKEKAMHYQPGVIFTSSDTVCFLPDLQSIPMIN